VAQLLLIRTLYHGVDVPSILDVVGRDAAIYFSVIALSHFEVVILFSVARVRPFRKCSSLTLADR